MCPLWNTVLAVTGLFLLFLAVFSVDLVVPRAILGYSVINTVLLRTKSQPMVDSENVGIGNSPKNYHEQFSTTVSSIQIRRAVKWLAGGIITHWNQARFEIGSLRLRLVEGGYPRWEDRLRPNDVRTSLLWVVDKSGLPLPFENYGRYMGLDVLCDSLAGVKDLSSSIDFLREGWVNLYIHGHYSYPRLLVVMEDGFSGFILNRGSINQLSGLPPRLSHLLKLPAHDSELAMINPESTESDQQQPELEPKRGVVNPMNFFRKVYGICWILIGVVAAALFSLCPALSAMGLGVPTNCCRDSRMGIGRLSHLAWRIHSLRYLAT